MIMRY